MKGKYITLHEFALICLITIFSIPGFSQYKIIDKNKSWNVLKSYKEQKTVSYKFLGDTIINNRNYTNLYYSFSDRLDTAEMFFAGSVREDTLKGTVYIRFITGEEYLIYSFKNDICEKLSLPSYNAATQIPFEVEYIDSVIIGGVKKKRIFLNSLDKSVAKDQIWVEGMGSLIGLIETGEVQYGKYWSKLLCVKNETGLIWSNKKGICYIVSASNANKIVFRKNKRNANAKIISLDFETKNLTVKVFNLKGKMIKERLIKTKKDLTIYHVRKGQYIIQVVDKFNKIYFSKKIKI